MAAVLHHQGHTSRSEQRRHGVLGARAVRHAVLRRAEHRLLPLEDEQSPRIHHVPLLLCLRGRLTGIRVRHHCVPGVTRGVIRARSRAPKMRADASPPALIIQSRIDT